MAKFPANYNPNQFRLLPEGVKRILIASAAVELDKYDKDGQREVVVLKVKILGEGEPNEIYTKFFRLPINWTVPGTTEKQKPNIIGGKIIWTMLKLIGVANTGSDVDVSPLEGKQFIWSITHNKVPKEPQPGVEQVTYSNIKSITLPGETGSTQPPPTTQPDPGPESGDEYEVPF
jgi:hypothetical protein